MHGMMGCQVYTNSRMLTGIIRIGELLDLIQAVDHLEESCFLFFFLRMHSFRCTYEAYTASTPLPVATALQVTNLPYTQHASLSVARTHPQRSTCTVRSNLSSCQLYAAKQPHVAKARLQSFS